MDGPGKDTVQFYYYLEAFAIVMKGITDIFDSFTGLDQNALCYTCSRVLEFQGEEEQLQSAQTMNVFTIYNMFRYAGKLKLGQADQILTQAATFRLLPRLLHQLVNNPCGLPTDTLEIGVLAVAALAVLEEFGDYTEQLLGDTVPLFVQFYNKYAKPMLADPGKRVYALCFEETLAWIRQAHPDLRV